jgi:phenylalanyl-tRNA synthetase beta chain
MLVSLEWMREFVDFQLSIAQLAEKLTMVGLEVEDIIYPQIEGLDKVVVGKIINKKNHPNANKLSICTVDIGTGHNLSVVCGAPNAREGLLSPLAIEGAVLPNGINIKAAEIRGEKSYGMLCSEKELKLGDDVGGIMELPPDFKPGTPLIEALGLDNVVLELELTPNRSECLSILGVAREVSAIIRKPLGKPKISFTEGIAKASDFTSVTIEAPDLCPRYAARLVRGVKIGPSPYWMCKRLQDMGLRSINNVVDITNYVLMELGHPLHAFDFNKLSEKRIVVRRAKPGEQIVTLDEVSRELKPDMLVIADAHKPVAVAGVMGGSGSDVTYETEDILIESAYFNPVSISKTSKLLGMHTEASHRFERGTDIEGLITALNRTTQLIQELAGGEICAGIVDTYPAPQQKAQARLRPHRANAILGINLKAEEMEEYLKSIEFQVSMDGDEMNVIVPTFRPDVYREIDLIEEIGRLYGYDNIPITMPVSGVQSASEADIMMNLRNRSKNALIACGLTEVVNYSFHGPNAFDMIQLEENNKYRRSLVIKNPISENQSVMRTTLIPVLLENVQHNIYRHVTDIQIFEMGRVFHPIKENQQPEEPEFVSGLMTGLVGSKLWNQPTRLVDFYDIKGVVEAFLDEMDIRNYQLRPANHPTIQPDRGAEIICQDDVIGMFGELYNKVLDNYDIHQSVYIFEINFSKLVKYMSGEIKFQPLPVYPSIYRDLAVVLDISVPASQIEEIIKSIGADLVKSLNLFDVYKGKQIQENKRSLAYSIEYYSTDRTLTDVEVDELHIKIISTLSDKFGAELRK